MTSTAERRGVRAAAARRPTPAQAPAAPSDHTQRPCGRATTRCRPAACCAHQHARPSAPATTGSTAGDRRARQAARRQPLAGAGDASAARPGRPARAGTPAARAGCRDRSPRADAAVKQAHERGDARMLAVRSAAMPPTHISQTSRSRATSSVHGMGSRTTCRATHLEPDDRGLRDHQQRDRPLQRRDRATTRGGGAVRRSLTRGSPPATAPTPSARASDGPQPFRRRAKALACRCRGSSSHWR